MERILPVICVGFRFIEVLREHLLSMFLLKTEMCLFPVQKLPYV